MGAAKGSTHGYDVVDHQRVNEELGGEAGLVHLSDALRDRGMGLVIDWVPNHMCIQGGQNLAWDDVLESGPSSVHADAFDIDWNPPKADLKNRVLLPILQRPYGDALERGEIRVTWDGDRFRVVYGDRKLPLGPKTLLPILEASRARAGIDEDTTEGQELGSIVLSLRNLPTSSDMQPEQRKERAREKEVVKRRLATLVESSPALRAAIDATLVDLNGHADDPKSFDALDQVLMAQCYRLAFWRVAAEEINYRRFFDVNDLAALRMENEPIFDAAHTLLVRLYEEGRFEALRLDHTDGLYDPSGYFEALHNALRPAERSSQADNPDDRARPLPILVEKILGRGEVLPSSWAVDGTTGYEHAVAVGGLWVDPAAEETFTALYRRFTGDASSFEDHVRASKKHVLTYSLSSELNMLARMLESIAATNRRWRDFTLISLTRALRETLAAFSVYRTYLRAGERPSAEDTRHVDEAIELARMGAPSIGAEVFLFLRNVMLVQVDVADDERRAIEKFALRVQQASAPVMAKSVEDTAFYRYPRLISLNEVGGSPEVFGRSIDELHALNALRARCWPLSMTPLSTHDTKRGEDASVRISALTEVPEAFARALGRLRERTRRLEVKVDEKRAPSPTLQYLFWQALVGVLPFGWDGGADVGDLVRRMSDYLLKAAREAKQETLWTHPNEAFEASIGPFVMSALEDRGVREILLELTKEIEPIAIRSALAQTTLKLTSPGIPDTYQGAELWNQSLVDPDNRAPVDFAVRRSLLGSLRARIHDAGSSRSALVRDLLTTPTDGVVKLFVAHVLLDLRRREKQLFLRGDYQGIVGGPHIVAFTRGFADSRLIVAVPRLVAGKAGPLGIGNQWGDAVLKTGQRGVYHDVFTGRETLVEDGVRLAEIFEDLPVAVLLRASKRPA